MTTTTQTTNKFRPTTFQAWLAALSILVGIGVAGMIFVLINGLSTTNLTDLVPWGIWITIDLSSIALSHDVPSDGYRSSRSVLARVRFLERTLGVVGSDDVRWSVLYSFSTGKYAQPGSLGMAPEKIA